MKGTVSPGDWSADGIILFGVHGGDLFRVAAAGGTPTRILPPPAHGAPIRLRPRFLPDGKRFTYVDMSRGEARPGLYLASLDGGAPRLLVPGGVSGAAYAPEGYLLYGRAGALFGRPFDPARATFVGEERPLVQGVAVGARFGMGAFSVSNTGVLATRPSTFPIEQLVWVDRQGRRLGTLGTPGRHLNFDLSPDGKRVVVSIPDPKTRLAALWLIEDGTGRTTLLAGSDDESYGDPIWSPDGRRIAYASEWRRRAILARSVHGEDETVLYETREGHPFLEDWSRDGTKIAFGFYPDNRTTPHGMILSLEGKAPIPFGETRTLDELHFSPDGAWVAYGASRDDRWEVFVTRAARPGEAWQISTRGGVQPRFSPDGKELYFLEPDGTLVAVEIARGADAEARPGVPRPLFATGLRPAPNHDQYAVAADGKRFLLNVPIDAMDLPPVDVAVSWAAGLSGR